MILYQIDSFTSTKFEGNPAGVILGADGLEDPDMQAIARELNNSETAFLFRSDDNDNDGVLRFFTPKIEVPSCGHATIAALCAYANEYKVSTGEVRWKTKVGVLPLTIDTRQGRIYYEMTQGKFDLQPPFEPHVLDELLQALRIDRDALDPFCPVQIASTGHSKVMVGVKSRQLLNTVRPDHTALTLLSEKIGCNGYFLFSFDSPMNDILTVGRMFAPAIGIEEDPVTGNAHGPLGGYLVKNNLVKFKKATFEFSGLQGEKINRPGIVKVIVHHIGGEPSQVKIRGEAKIIFRTTLQV